MAECCWNAGAKTLPDGAAFTDNNPVLRVRIPEGSVKRHIGSYLVASGPPQNLADGATPRPRVDVR
jgi:hypothetical protein